jgi:sugar O-acyltransferase (sialic acid O-acetyltransferase NeuD family)
MSGNKIYIIGAGGFAREVLNVYIDSGRENDVLGFLEENCTREGELLNDKPIYDISVLENSDRKNIKLICGIGTPLRKKLIEYTKKLGYDYDTIIHPNVVKSRWVEIGEGCIICAGNIITTQVSIGDFTIINLDCTIGHDVTIGKYTNISPGVNVSGRVSIGDECFIGTGAAVVPNVSIGNRCFIGAGAVVTKDIPDNVLAVGVPAKPIKKLTEHDWRRMI